VTNLRFIYIPIMILLLAAGSFGQGRQAVETEIQGHTMYTLLKPGDIPAIFEPEFVSVAAAESLYFDEEPLLVVAGKSETKAYSTWHLDRHEIVNDYIDGEAITVTW